MTFHCLSLTFHSVCVLRAEALQNCLDRFTKSEDLEGDDKYFCSQCKIATPSTKQVRVQRTFFLPFVEIRPVCPSSQNFFPSSSQFKTLRMLML